MVAVPPLLLNVKVTPLRGIQEMKNVCMLPEITGAPDWVTVWLLPATVMVALLEFEPVLADTEYVTVPLPLPLFPDVIFIQSTLSVAVQLHPPGAVTLTVPVPPLSVNDRLVGEIV